MLRDMCDVFLDLFIYACTDFNCSVLFPLYIERSQPRNRRIDISDLHLIGRIYHIGIFILPVFHIQIKVLVILDIICIFSNPGIVLFHRLIHIFHPALTKWIRLHLFASLNAHDRGNRNHLRFFLIRQKKHGHHPCQSKKQYPNDHIRPLMLPVPETEIPHFFRHIRNLLVLPHDNAADFLRQ